jgi:hypothetical protein
MDEIHEWVCRSQCACILSVRLYPHRLYGNLASSPDSVVYYTECRKRLLPHSDAIKRRLKMTSEDSIGKFHRKFTVSYAVRKRRLVHQTDSNVTETIVGLDDNYPEPPYADSADDDRSTEGALEIHTS